MKRLALAAAALALLSGCSSGFEITGPDLAFRQLKCSAGHRGSGMVILLAQSVPTAAALPCLRESPADWTLAAFEPRKGSAHLGLTDSNDSMRFDTDVVSHCDPGAAAESPSEQPGMRRYSQIRSSGGRYRLDRYYVAPGACVAFHFDGGGSHADRSAEDVMTAFGFITRDDIDRGLASESDGRLHLDPAP